MTLIITYVSRRRIFQCGDFRLTDARSGGMIDYLAQKQIFVARPGWTALVGFCGIAHTGRKWVPDWIVEQLRGIGPQATFDALIDALASAESWLARRPARSRALTFSVGAFVEFRSLFVLMSNFEALGRPSRPRLTSFPSSLEVSSYRPKKERLFLSGRPASVLPAERLSLIGLFRKNPAPEAAYSALAEVNRRAAHRDPSVGEPCFTSLVNVLGECGGTVHGWPADRDFLPAFMDVNGIIFPRIRRGIDEHGRPTPLKLEQAQLVAMRPSQRYFRFALEEKPGDPSTLSNYGNWLKGQGRTAEAEAAYLEAIEIDPAFANAYNNLAILLEECGELDAAERAYRRATELQDTSQLWFVNLAVFLWLRRDRIDDAAELFDRAISAQRDAFTLGRRAWFTEWTGDDPGTARHLYEEALAMAPRDLWLNGRFAIFLRSQGEDALAREHFEFAVAGEQPEHDWLVAYALLEAQEGDLEMARALLERAVRSNPRSPDAIALLAAVRRETGAKRADVERMYRKALHFHPDHSTASLNLAQLLLQEDPADEEARRLLTRLADRGNMTDEARMELLFYGFAYQLPGFDDADQDILRLAGDGGQLAGWDLSLDVAAAERMAHPRPTRVRELAELLTSDQ